MKNDDLLHKWINKTISEEELKIFRQRPEFDSLTQLYEATADFKAPAYDEAAMLSNILEKDKKKKDVGRKERRLALSWVKYGVAASVLIFAGWFLFSNLNQTVEYKLAKGEKKEGLLLDGSSFVLNAESTLDYNKKSWAKDRSLNLKGEAFFKVEKGARFLVNTPNGKVEVLGTQFNVWSRGEVLEVKCFSGKVAVFSADGKEVELEPQDAVRFVPGKEAEQWTFAPSEQVSWIDGISRFKKAKLTIVLEELERQYNIKIDTKAVETSTIISCNFPHQNLQLALKAVLQPLGIKYDFKSDKEIHLYTE